MYSEYQNARYQKSGQPDSGLFTLANGETVIAHYVPLIRDKKTIGVFAYTSMNTIDYMSTLSTVEIVRRLNDELNQFKKELRRSSRVPSIHWQI